MSTVNKSMVIKYAGMAEKIMKTVKTAHPGMDSRSASHLALYQTHIFTMILRKIFLSFSRNT